MRSEKFNKMSELIFKILRQIASSFKLAANYVLLICIIHLSNTSIQAQNKRKTQVKPDFGVILNEDGDFAFIDSNPRQAERLLRANVDGHAALGVKTYTFSIGAGSDVLYYATKIASPYGWRKTKYEDENDSWRVRVQNARLCISAGLDAVQIAGEEAKKNNLLFLPSLRMNDSHFMADPNNYPLTGQFWLENTDLIIKDSPISFDKNYGNLLDYSSEKVRNFRFAVFNEAIELHKKVIDGFELDFNRVQVFFPKGKANKELMTDLVRKIRNRLNKLSKEEGRPMYLFARIPPSVEACIWAGLDVETWMKEGLIDVISPAQLMTLAHDMPIKTLIEEAKKYKIQVYPSLYPRTSFRVPLQPSAKDFGMKEPFGRMAILPEILAAAANYRDMGADGFYLYNFKGGDKDEGFRPHPSWFYALVASLKYNKADAGEKVFAVTKTYYNDNVKPSYAYIKQLPRKVLTKEDFTILIGELPNESPFPLTTCILRIGVKSYKNTPLTVNLNEKTLTILQETNQSSQNNGKPLTPDMAEQSLVYGINDLALLKRGDNKISIEGKDIIITDIEIGYAYYNQLNNFMLGKKPPPLNFIQK